MFSLLRYQRHGVYRPEQDPRLGAALGRCADPKERHFVVILLSFGDRQAYGIAVSYSYLLSFFSILRWMGQNKA